MTYAREIPDHDLATGAFPFFDALAESDCRLARGGDANILGKTWEYR